MFVVTKQMAERVKFWAGGKRWTSNADRAKQMSVNEAYAVAKQMNKGKMMRVFSARRLDGANEWATNERR